jgi:hypothetical protein
MYAVLCIYGCAPQGKYRAAPPFSAALRQAAFFDPAMHPKDCTPVAKHPPALFDGALSRRLTQGAFDLIRLLG